MSLRSIRSENRPITMIIAKENEKKLRLDLSLLVVPFDFIGNHPTIEVAR